jgi:hypothetical protein
MPARRQAIPAIQDNQMAAGYFFLGAHHVFLRPQALWDCPDHIPEYANARRPYRLLMPIDRGGPRDLPQMVPWESEHAAPTCFHAPLAPGTSSRYGSPLKDHFIVADWTPHRRRTDAARMLQRFSPRRRLLFPRLERIPVMFERSRRDERSFCILGR